MGIEEIKYPNAKQEGVTPEIDKARELGLLMPFDESLDWLRVKAESELKRNDEMLLPDKTESPTQMESVPKVRPHETDPVVEMDRLILERSNILQECGEIEKKIAQNLFGVNIEQLPVTPSRIAIAHIGELIQVLEKNDPGIETVTQARKRLTRLLELAQLLKSYMMDVEEEARHFTNNE